MTKGVSVGDKVCAWRQKSYSQVREAGIQGRVAGKGNWNSRSRTGGKVASMVGQNL